MLNLLFKNEATACRHVEDLIRILAHPSLRQQIGPLQSNDETVLIFSILLSLIMILKNLTITCFLRSKTIIQEVLLNLAENSPNEVVSLRAYGNLSRIVTNEQLKALRIGDGIVRFFFQMMDEAWRHPSKRYRRIPIGYFLKSKFFVHLRSLFSFLSISV